jgi:hypothetical protein
MPARADNEAVFRSDSSDRWYWSADVFLPLAFCVWVLGRDGLVVPPFDQHPDGDHGLQERGLDPQSWREWVTALIAARARMHELARATFADPGSPSDRHALAVLGEALHRPSVACPGSDELRTHLDDLWADYEPAGNAWKRAMTIGRGPLGGAAVGGLWQALLPFHQRLETLEVFLVDYVRPAVMPLPPVTCLISTGADEPREQVFARMVLQGAEELASTAG